MGEPMSPPPDSKPDNPTGARAVSVIILTRDRLPKLQVCLDRLLPQLSAEDEIILIDTGSADGTVEFYSQTPPLASASSVLKKKEAGPRPVTSASSNPAIPSSLFSMTIATPPPTGSNEAERKYKLATPSAAWFSRIKSSIGRRGGIPKWAGSSASPCPAI